MFDLEQEIKKWKRSLLKQDAFEDGLLAEIELHLRDAYDEGRSAGLDEASAFRAAVAQMGPADRIASEHRKNREVGLNRRAPLRLGRFMPGLAWSYFKSALRAVRRGRGLAVINIIGLSVGLAAFALVLLFVQYEFRYEKHHVNAARIYRLVVEQNLGDRVFLANMVPVPLAEALRREVPEVEEFARFVTRGRIIVARGERRFIEEGFSFCDPGALRMFTYPMLKGSAENALANNSSAVITAAVAAKYFGDEDPMGQTLTLDFGTKVDVVVTGVMADHPPTTDFAPQILVRLELFRSVLSNPDEFFNNWISNQIRSYILVRQGTDTAALERKIMTVFRPHYSEGDRRIVRLERLATAHLRPLDAGDGARGTRTLTIFLLCGILVLVTACINFMNLATARSASRAREVGLRKVVGASRPQLIRQFLGESLVYAIVSLAIALVMAILALPLLNSLTGQSVVRADLGRSGAIPILLGTAVLSGLMAGSYPALYLSGLKPVRVLKNRLGDRGAKGAPLRKVLVVAQFTISIILIISTLIFGRQLRYIQNKPLGFEKDRILVLRVPSGPALRDLAPLKAALLRDPRIAGVCGSQQLPSSIGMYNNVTWEGARADERIELMFCRIDYDFLDTFGIGLAAGRNFSLKFPADAVDGTDPKSPRGVILNEEAVRRMGWTDPIGRQVIEDYGDGRTYMKVVGVVKDFHFTSLRSAIRPMNFFLSTGSNRFVSVKIRTDDLRGAVGFVEAAWKSLYPDLPVDSFFLDSVFDRYYQAEERQRKLFGILSLLAVFIASLGLFGLAAHAAEQRTKEIGIRKTLGASTPGIIRLLSWEFTRWVLVANLLAWPIAYLFLNGWLRGFAYRIGLPAQWGWFVFAAVLSLVIAWLTVGAQAVKAAAANPVRSLRYE
jgi:putative ABC transport system permease protein